MRYIPEIKAWFDSVEDVRFLYRGSLDEMVCLAMTLWCDDCSYHVAYCKCPNN
jgi:hypothetical protein